MRLDETRSGIGLAAGSSPRAGALITLGFNAAARLLSLVYRYLLAVSLGPAHYGAAALEISLFLGFQPVATLELGAVLSWLVRTKDQARRILKSLLPLVVAAVAVAAVGAWSVGFFSDAYLGLNSFLVLPLLFLAFLLSAISVSLEGSARGMLSYFVAGWAVVLAPLGRILLLGGLLFLAIDSGQSVVSGNPDLWRLSFYAGPALIIAAVLWFAFKKDQSDSDLPQPNGAVLPAIPDPGAILWRHAAPLLAAAWTRGMFLFAIREFTPPAHRGEVDLALTVYSLWALIVASTMSALLPHLARGRTVHIGRPLLLVAVVSVLASAFSIAFRPTLESALALIYLSEYMGLVAHIPLLLIAAPFDVLANFESTRLQAQGRHLAAGVLVALAHVAALVFIWMFSSSAPLLAPGIGFVAASATAAGFLWMYKLFGPNRVGIQ